MDEAVTGAAADAAEFAARGLFRFADAELVAVLRSVHRLMSVWTAITGLVVQEAAGRGLPKGDDAVSTVVWLRDLLRIGAGDARRWSTGR